MYIEVFFHFQHGNSLNYEVLQQLGLAKRAHVMKSLYFSFETHTDVKILIDCANDFRTESRGAKF